MRLFAQRQHVTNVTGGGVGIGGAMAQSATLTREHMQQLIW